MQRRALLKNIAFAAAAAGTLGRSVFADEDWGTFKMTVLNCLNVNGGAGLAVVMQAPNGKAYLFDTGTGGFATPKGTLDPLVYNCGRDTIDPYLKEQRIGEIESIVISHGHGDHIGGLEWLLRHYPVKNLYDSGYRFPDRDPATHTTGEIADHQRLLKEFRTRRPNNYFEVQYGATLDWGSQLKVKVLSPPPGYFDVLPNPNRPKNDTPIHHLLNANSLALQIKHGDNVCFIVGDIQEDHLKAKLWPMLSAEEKKCDVCVLPSHGIHSIREEAEATRPKIAVGSVWAPWAKSIPAWRVYREVGAEVYVTGMNGHVEITSDGTSLTVKTQYEYKPR